MSYIFHVVDESAKCFALSDEMMRWRRGIEDSKNNIDNGNGSKQGTESVSLMRGMMIKNDWQEGEDRMNLSVVLARRRVVSLPLETAVKFNR